MALKHILQLDVPDTACENVLKVIDMSAYLSNDVLPVTCPQLSIIVPGMTQPVFFTTDLPKNFSRIFTAIDLEIGTSAEQAIPDGVYKISYSISPNDKVYISYYHLRTTMITNRYYAELCKLHLGDCEPTAEEKQKVNDLRFIKMLIDGAKAKVEYCHTTNQGVKMLEYAHKLLDKYVTGCCITCR